MPRYDFTAQAELDLESIADYTLAHWGRAQVLKYLDGLDERAQKPANASPAMLISIVFNIFPAPPIIF